MLSNNRSKPTLKPVLKLKQFLNTIPYSQTASIRNSIESSRYVSNHQISNSVRRNGSNQPQSLLPSITNRKSLVIETIHYQVNVLDHVLTTKKNNKTQNFRKLKNLSLAQSNYLNITNEEIQAVQSIKNSPEKPQKAQKQMKEKSRRQKLIEFLRGENQTISYLLSKKSTQNKTLLPSFIIKKYQELQF